MDVRPPPFAPVFAGQKVVPTREYRVVFWEHQLPPEDSGIPAEEMGWAELTVDLRDVEDVQEAVAWAEANIDPSLDQDHVGPHGERIYVLYAKVPDEDTYLHITGWDPTLDRRVPERNLHRWHPPRS